MVNTGVRHRKKKWKLTSVCEDREVNTEDIGKGIATSYIKQ